MRKPKMAIPRNIGPITAMALLEAFLQRQWELTEEEGDELFDVVIGALERARDERYRMAAHRSTNEEDR